MKDIENLTKASLEEELKRVERLFRRYKKEYEAIRERLHRHYTTYDSTGFNTGSATLELACNPPHGITQEKDELGNTYWSKPLLTTDNAFS